MTENEYQSTEQEGWTDVQNHLNRFGNKGKKEQTLKSIVNRIVAKRGLAGNQGNQQVSDCWHSLLPPNMDKKTRVGNIKRGTLEIQVSDPATLQQLNFLKAQLLKQMKQKLPAVNLKNFRLKLGNF